VAQRGPAAEVEGMGLQEPMGNKVTMPFRQVLVESHMGKTTLPTPIWGQEEVAAGLIAIRVVRPTEAMVAVEVE
jgi:hypothetical protein